VDNQFQTVTALPPTQEIPHDYAHHRLRLFSDHRLSGLIWNSGRRAPPPPLLRAVRPLFQLKAKTMTRPPLPPFTTESATEKVRLAEDGWNSRDAARVALAYTPDSQWRNRAEFVSGREAIEAFLVRKWSREQDYRLIKELWAQDGNRIAVRFAYEYRDDSGQWFRAYGNENWEFDADGLMRRRIASINEHPIAEADRKFHWPLGRRPDDHLGLSQLGF
jgi:nuclear transport factor 2 (NTF2) superfamily protein